MLARRTGDKGPNNDRAYRQVYHRPVARVVTIPAASDLLCEGCGFVPECPNCSVTLTVHRAAHPRRGPRCRSSRLTSCGTFLIEADYLLGHAIARAPDPKRRKRWLVVTVQLSSLAQDMEAGYREGFGAGLDNLAGVAERTMLLQRVIRALNDDRPYSRFVREQIAGAQVRAALAVNRELVLLYWQIGSDILARQAAQGWGAKVIERLAHDLRTAFPEMKGFSRANLMYMRAFAEAWGDADTLPAGLAIDPSSGVISGTATTPISTWPPRRSGITCPVPLYGMCWNLVPVVISSSETAMWPTEPMPDDPDDLVAFRPVLEAMLSGAHWEITET